MCLFLRYNAWQMWFLFFSLAYFLPFYPSNNPKNHNFKKPKNTWRYHHFTCVPKIMITWCKVPEISCATDKEITVPVPSFCWGATFSPRIWKEGIKKIKSAWGDLENSCHRCLPGRLTMFLVKKKLLKIKYGFQGSISNVDFGLF